MTQSEALSILKAGFNVYLTGQAGSGKTHVLNQYIKHLRGHDVEVGITASTGIAATHMNGTTIHSWSGIGVKDFLKASELEALQEKKYLYDRIKKTQVLVIDEVSMLAARTLDLVDLVCRSFKRIDKPFGGMQIVLCGDLFQLPPVARGGERVPPVPASRAWASADIKICYLHEQHRQHDPVFVSVLNDIRTNGAGEETVKILESRFQAELPTDKLTRLYTHNADVDEINARELDKLPGEPRILRMASKGKDALVEALKKGCLAPDLLALKPGAAVMFVKNNYEQGYVNGTLGTVVGFTNEDYPIVETLQGKRIEASPATWTVEEDGKALAEIAQVPLRLAWAITIHKSQGMSLDAAEIDLSKTFVSGQGYVALSRVRSLDGLRLTGFDGRALVVDPEVLNFDLELQASSEAMVRYVRSLPAADLKAMQESFIERSEGSLIPGRKKEKPKKPSTVDATKELILKKMSIKNIAATRSLTPETVIEHVEKIKELNPKIDLDYLKPPKAKFELIRRAFKDSGDTRLGAVKELLGSKVTYDELRVARLFIS